MQAINDYLLGLHKQSAQEGSGFTLPVICEHSNMVFVLTYSHQLSGIPLQQPPSICSCRCSPWWEGVVSGGVKFDRPPIIRSARDEDQGCCRCAAAAVLVVGFAQPARSAALPRTSVFASSSTAPATRSPSKKPTYETFQRLPLSIASTK